MHDVQFDLVHHRITKFAGVPSRGFDTDKNFAIVKSYDVRWATFVEELEMQSRDSPIGNQPYKNFTQLAQVSSFALLQSQTSLHSIGSERFQLGDVDCCFSLQVAY